MAKYNYQICVSLITGGDTTAASTWQVLCVSLNNHLLLCTRKRYLNVIVKVDLDAIDNIVKDKQHAPA